MAERRVVVVGGGVIGICCAYYLARRGAQVTLLERDQVGRGASFGNSGAIAPGHPPLNKPERIRQGLKLFLDPLSPLHIPPRWDPGLARWLVKFRANCTEAQVSRVMDTMAPLGHDTLELFDELVSTEALDCGYTRTGYYEVCRSGRALDSVRRDAELMRGHGYGPVEVRAGELREREPVMKDGMEGAVFYPEAARCNPLRFVTELADRVEARGGAVHAGANVTGVLRTGSRVSGLQTEGGEIFEADAVVLATGAYSLGLVERLGLRLPVQAGKGYHRDLAVGPGGAPELGIQCVLSETSVYCTPMDGHVRFAGTMEFSGVNHDMRRPRLEQLTRAADLYLEGVEEEAVLSEWCGLRPVTPDGFPIVGPVPGVDGLFIATGHSMLGLTLGPVTGEIVADYVLEGGPRRNVAAMLPDRF